MKVKHKKTEKMYEVLGIHYVDRQMMYKLLDEKRHIYKPKREFVILDDGNRKKYT